MWDFVFLTSIINVIKSRMMKWMGHVACVWAMQNTYKISVDNPKGNGPYERSRHRWEDNIKVDCVCKGVD
jgi:hypothetical protein